MLIFWTSNQFSASRLHIIYSYFKSALLTELFLVMELCQQNPCTPANGEWWARVRKELERCFLLLDGWVWSQSLKLSECNSFREKVCLRLRWVLHHSEATVAHTLACGGVPVVVCGFVWVTVKALTIISLVVCCSHFPTPTPLPTWQGGREVQLLSEGWQVGLCIGDHSAPQLCHVSAFRAQVLRLANWGEHLGEQTQLAGWLLGPVTAGTKTDSSWEDCSLKMAATVCLSRILVGAFRIC